MKVMAEYPAETGAIARQSDDTAFAAIRSALCYTVGEGNALTIDELAQVAGLDRRRTEHLLETRFADFPFLMASGPRGYFRPQTPDEVNHYPLSLQSRIKCLALRLRAYRRQAAREGWRRDQPRAPYRRQPADLFDVGGAGSPLHAQNAGASSATERKVNEPRTPDGRNA
jgi:hypothetical protein